MTVPQQISSCIHKVQELRLIHFIYHRRDSEFRSRASKIQSLHNYHHKDRVPQRSTSEVFRAASNRFKRQDLVQAQSVRTTAVITTF